MTDNGQLTTLGEEGTIGVAWWYALSSDLVRA